jgi:hypothetical protein
MSNSIHHDRKEIRQDNLILKTLAALIVIAVLAYSGYAGWLAYRNAGYTSYGASAMAVFG